jgi:hypothetical protein
MDVPSGYGFFGRDYAEAPDVTQDRAGADAPVFAPSLAVPRPVLEL